MKFLKNIFILVIVVVVALALTKNIIVKAVIEKGTEAATGLPLHIKDLKLNLMKTLVDITELRLSNPKGFSDKTMLSMPKIYLDFDLPAAFKGKTHIEAIIIHLDEFVVVKNRDGKLNLDTLKAVAESKKPKEAPAEKKPAEMPKVSIDLLELKIGKVIYKDYSAGDQPAVKEFDINLNETFTDVKDINDISKIILVKALSGTIIGQLVNFDVSGFASQVSDTLATSAKAVGDQAAQAAVNAAKEAQAQAMKAATAAGAEQLGKAAEGAKEELQDAAAGVADKAGEAVSSIKEKIVLPFGKKTE